MRGRELENNVIVHVAPAANTAWRLLVAICFMLSGSRIRDEELCAMSLQGSHALISLQSQLHQQGLHNPWYTVTMTTQAQFAPLQSWWDYEQLASHTIICQEQCLIGPQDQYFVED